jgi:hypothetical protein
MLVLHGSSLLLQEGRQAGSIFNFIKFQAHGVFFLFINFWSEI